MARLSRERRSVVTALVAGFIGLGLVAEPASSWADPACGRIYLTNTQNELLRLRRSAQYLAGIDAPNAVNRQLDARTPIGGLAANEALIGIDFRPATGMLYGVGRIGAEALGQLYTIDLSTGLATAVGGRTIPLDGAAFGVDFNPVPDRLRIVSDTGKSQRINPDTGAVAGTDTDVAYPAMGDPNSTRMARIVAVAYTNPDTDLQTNTVLHDLDVNRAGDPDLGASGDVLAIQVPPNAGVLNTVGRLGVDADDLATFDIGPNNEAFAAIRPQGSAFSRLYRVDLASGAGTDFGQIAQAELINGLAIQVGPVCNP
jgi:hypothetical protein